MPIESSTVYIHSHRASFSLLKSFLHQSGTHPCGYEREIPRFFHSWRFLVFSYVVNLLDSSMGSVMSLSCSKRKATSQDVESSSNESVKRRKICSMNDDENCSLIPTLPNELSWKHPWTFCANSVFNVAAAVGFFTRFTKVSFQQDNKDTISSLSLPSTSTFVSRIWKHPVFPSFHGEDVRKTFLSHILESFRRKGIDPFIDNHIPRSKSIGPELIEAIRGSKIAIVLLSKNYASSSWCLDELVEIMKCREELSQIVMTIFYEVDPTEVKKRTGDFGKSFRKTCKGKTKEHIERWRKALEDVATIAGEHSRNWSNEAAMIEKIATDVSNMLNRSTPSRDFDGLVGMRAHMERMEHVLRLDLDEVRMIGIWGPPGIGKTTIARVLFNQVSNRFQLSALMVDIKGCYPRPGLDEYNAQLQPDFSVFSVSSVFGSVRLKPKTDRLSNLEPFGFYIETEIEPNLIFRFGSVRFGFSVSVYIPRATPHSRLAKMISKIVHDRILPRSSSNLSEVNALSERWHEVSPP